MVKLPSAKVYSKSVSVSYPGQSLKCVKVTTLGPRTLVYRCNGFDPETNIHLMQTFGLHVLLYGLKLVLPSKTLINKLETYCSGLRPDRARIEHLVSD